MARPTAEEIAGEYANQRKKAKPADRSAINTRFRIELTTLASQVTSEITAAESQLVSTADEFPERRRIRQQIEILKFELGDVADLVSLIDARSAEDEQHRLLDEAAKLVSRRRQVEKRFADWTTNYTAKAKALAKEKESLLEIIAESEQINGQSEQLVKAGCAEADAALGRVGYLRDVGYIVDAVHLPSITRGVAHWGKSVTGDDRPPRPEVPNPIPDDWGCSMTDGRITNPLPGSIQDVERRKQIDRSRGEREDAIARAAEWDRTYGREWFGG